MSRRPGGRAKYTKWVVWANAALDPICFAENEKGQVIGTRLDQPSRALSVLNDLLAEDDYLVGNDFSVADVAVASYLNYVPLFFPRVALGVAPNVDRARPGRYKNERSRRARGPRRAASTPRR